MDELRQTCIPGNSLIVSPITITRQEMRFRISEDESPLFPIPITDRAEAEPRCGYRPCPAGDLISVQVAPDLQRGSPTFLLWMEAITARASLHHRLQTITINSKIDLLENAGYYQPEPKTLGEYIRKARIDRKLTAKELAEQIGCPDDILLAWV